MQPKALLRATVEESIEAASRSVDRQVREMLQDLEDDACERDYEERLHVLRARSDRFDDGW